MQSLKKNIIKTSNRNTVNMQHYKWIGINRQNKEGVGIGFLIEKSIIKSCTIEPILYKTIEFISIKLNLTNNESMMVCLYYGKQESKSTKKRIRKRI